MPFELPKINLPQINQQGINTALVMEAVAPGTGIITGGIVSNNPGIFDGVSNWFSNLGKGGTSSPTGTGTDQRGGDTNYSGISNKSIYIILGVLVVVVIAVVVLTRKKS